MPGVDVYTKTIVVLPAHIDALLHVNNVQYLHWMMEAAEEHWKARATDKQQSELIWVVNKHEIHYRGSARIGENLELTTFTGECSGAGWWRHFTIRNTATNAVIVNAQTLFVLLSRITEKPLRIQETVLQIFKQA
ncbi:MAG: acyl-CoA thioesterase [Sediminibacterium sp.]|nr:acyl-CoA thioesterase [Sediminibacterium sp.]